MNNLASYLRGHHEVLEVPISAAIESRSNELLAIKLTKIRVETDYMFSGLMVIQFIAGILIALTLSPTMWSAQESSVHVHVYYAIILGATISGLPMYMTYFFAGRATTRYVIATAQMFWSALLIHLCGGRIETHFHIFVSFAFLAFYLDPKVLIIATCVTTLDHMVRGTILPYSVYGLLTASHLRSLEHAAWVLFEDVGLIVSIRHSLSKFKKLTVHRAIAEQSHQAIEVEVKNRTEELKQRTIALESAQASLMLSNERLLLATEGTYDGIWDWDLVRNTVWVSDHFLEMLGYQKNELQFSPDELLARTHEEDRARIRDVLKQHFEINTPYDTERRLLTKSGEYRCFRTRGRCVRDSSGKPIRMSGSMQDITDQKRLEGIQRVQEDIIRQKQKLELVGSLAGGVTHEFNNLLQVIQGFTSCARSGLKDQDLIAQDLDHVLDATNRAASLTRQLLDYSRSERINLASIDIASVTKNIIGSLRPLVVDGIVLKLTVEKNLPRVMGDANGIHQVLMNLCLNAQDAMPLGGQIDIDLNRCIMDSRQTTNEDTLQPVDYVCVRVTDTGMGMTPEHMQRAFEPFFTTKEIGKGTGLGLAVVHGIVQQHNGKIDVSSELGFGTTFRVYFPSCLTLDIAPENVTPWLGGGKETILLVEDDAMVRTIARRFLEDSGYKVVEATNGEEAVDIFKILETDISLIILDHRMPKRSGRSIYGEISKSSANIPVIFCSGFDPEMSNVPLPNSSTLIRKPYNSIDLLNAVRTVLDKASLAKTLRPKTDLPIPASS